MGTPSLKIKISKIGLRHVLSWPKLGLETKFHEPGTFGGFGKREQTNRHTDKIHESVMPISSSFPLQRWAQDVCWEGVCQAAAQSVRGGAGEVM